MADTYSKEVLLDTRCCAATLSRIEADVALTAGVPGINASVAAEEVIGTHR